MCIFFFSGQCLKTSQPDFVTPLRDITVEVGRNATFECFVTNIEKYRVRQILIPKYLEILLNTEGNVFQIRYYNVFSIEYIY